MKKANFIPVKIVIPANKAIPAPARGGSANLCGGNAGIRITSLFLALALSFISMPPAHAAVPKLLTYQGVLKNGSGSFLTGTYSMVFRIYSASTGGSALWTETQSSVSTSSGKFSVQLGSVTALNLDFNSDYWLSIQVGSDAEMSPRVRLTSMGYGIRSDYENNGFVQSAHDALTHKNVEGVKDNTVNIAKTNFKLDAYTLASANSMGDLIVDTLNDSTGINSGASSNYTWRGSPNYDVVLAEGGIDSYAKLVLHANGTNGSTTFTDSSTSSKTVTVSGNAQISTTSPKFGSGSGALDGSGDYLSVADSSDWDFGTQDFTIDFWVRFNSVVTNTGLIDIGDFASGKGVTINIGNSTQVEVGFNNVRVLFATGLTAFTTGQWYHFAVTRSGTTAKFFLDGVEKVSATDSTDITGGTSALIGYMNAAGISPVNGYMDEVRISKGVARWSSNFTPPSAEYTAPSGSATVISNAYSEPAAPTEAIVIPDETLGTGSITYYVSRDNGTTWTQVTKETVTSISSQPSGTQVKWKAVITGNAELNAIAMAV